MEIPTSTECFIDMLSKAKKLITNLKMDISYLGAKSYFLGESHSKPRVLTIITILHNTCIINRRPYNISSVVTTKISVSTLQRQRSERKSVANSQ